MRTAAVLMLLLFSSDSLSISCSTFLPFIVCIPPSTQDDKVKKDCIGRAKERGVYELALAVSGERDLTTFET